MSEALMYFIGAQQRADELRRMKEALVAIQTSGNNEDPTAQWMQKVAAHALYPHLPKPDVTPPKRTT